MGVMQLLARCAASRAHVLIVEVPGYWVVRAEAERRLLARGWCVALSPADADILAVCGRPGPELAEAIQRVWDQLPGPRVLIEIPTAESVQSVLDRALAQLVDVDTQRTDARTRDSVALDRDDSRSRRDGHHRWSSDGTDNSPESHCGHGQEGHDVMDHSAVDHGQHQPINHDAADHIGDRSPDHSAIDHSGHQHMDHQGMEHSGHDHMDHASMEHSGHDHMNHHVMEHSAHDHMDHASTDHSGHGHMHHGAMEMAPAGIALAEGGEDRDGLEMDVLHVRLGPVLSCWPAGLVLGCALQGDVLIEADAWVVDRDTVQENNLRPHQRDDSVLLAARHCDHATDLLLLAGWARAATTARMARDTLISESASDNASLLLEALHRSIGRSRMVRWSLRDLAPLTVEDCGRLQLPTILAGDSYDRLLAHVGMARRVLRDPLPPGMFDTSSRPVVDVLPGLVCGLDLATARLVIASLGIDTAPQPAGGGHG